MSISSIVYGINDVSDISSSTPQFTADKARVGWNYQASGATDNIQLTIFSEDGFTNTNNLFNITVRGAVGNTTYANIPYLSIKTKPKADGTDFDPSFHSQQIFKIDNDDFVSPDELVYFYYNNLVSQLDEFKKTEYKLVQTNGTLDENNPILSVELISNNSSTTSFYLQNTEVISKNHQHKFNRIIEYRNQDTEANLEGVIDELELILDQNTVTASNTSSINNKISKGNDFTLSQAQQVLVYGEVTTGPQAGELHPIHITNSGDVEVEIADFVKGQNVMSNSFPVVIASDQSEITTTPKINDPVSYTETINVPLSGTGNGSPMNTTGYNIIGFAFNSSNTSDPVHIQVSHNSITWFTSQTLFFPIQSEEIKDPAFKYYRLQQTDTTASNHTISVLVSRRVI